MAYALSRHNTTRGLIVLRRPKQKYDSECPRMGAASGRTAR